MNFKQSLVISAFSFIPMSGFTSTAWLGDLQTQITREPQGVCEGHDVLSYSGPVEYGTWARERAGARYLCFEAWLPGVTDHGGNAINDGLQVHYRFHPSEPFQVMVPRGAGRDGNNQIFA